MPTPEARHAARVPTRGRSASYLTVPVGLLLSMTLVWQASAAAFTSTTVNPGNSFAAGDVTLIDDDSGSAMFSLTNLKPGVTASRCIAVTYQGSLAADVKLFVASGDLTGTGLGSYLDLVIEQGSGGNFGSCGSFSAASTLWTGTLANFAATATNSATGVGSFSPSAAGQTRTYRFTVTLQDDNAAQNRTAGTTFTWEATST